MADEIKKSSMGDTYYKVSSLNRWFLLSSLVMLLSYVWSVWDDYAREWKSCRRDFLDEEYIVAGAQAKLAWGQAGGPVANRTLKELFEKQDAARLQLDADHHVRPELVKAVAEAELEFNLINADMKKAKARFEAERFHYEEAAFGEEDLWAPRKSSNQRTLEHYLELKRRFFELDDDNKRAEEILTRERASLAAHDSAITEIQKQVDELEREVGRLERKQESVDTTRLFTKFRNALFVDFMAPNVKVEKIVVKEIFDDLNFLRVPKVDMCITCHAASDRHKEYAYDDPKWEEYEDLKDKAVFKAHSRPELFATSLSPHSQERFGCSGCHLGNGQRLTFNLAFHTPAHEEQRKDWEEKHHWHEAHYWDHPMLSSSYVEASCYKCHNQEVHIPGADQWNRGRDLVEYYGCFGCHKLAPMENHRKVGPPLYHIESKLKSPEFALKWVEAPKSFRADARMPTFFHLDNKKQQEERQRAEVTAIVQYLYNLSTPVALRRYPGSGDPERGKKLFGDTGGVGCLACHDMAGFSAEGLDPLSHGPDLSGIGSKVTEDWLFTWLLDPGSVWIGEDVEQGWKRDEVPLDPHRVRTNMPNLRLTEQEAADLVAYLKELRNPEFDAKVFRRPEDDSLYDQILKDKFLERMTEQSAGELIASMSALEKRRRAGEFLVNHYGCTGCHLIAGHENDKQIGTELNGWGSKHADRLDFGTFEMHWKAEGKFKRESWLEQKLANTRFFDQGKDRPPFEQLKMPQFPLEGDNLEAVATFVLSLRNDHLAQTIKRNLDGDELAVERGRQIVRNKNCLGCHVLYREGGRLRKFIGEAAAGFFPPLLDGQGARTQYDWLFEFLTDPSMGGGRGSKAHLRTWMKARMPTFDFSQQELNDLIAYFAQEELWHTSEDRGKWAQVARKFEKDFNGYDEKSVRQAEAGKYQLYQKLVARGYKAVGGTFLAQIDFPNTAPAKELSESDLELARELFKKNNCVLCHLPSGIPPEGKTEADLAPNLAYTKDRLQPKWVRHWLVDPLAYQPGTRMTAFWPIVPETGARRSAWPEKINDAEREMDLVRDYLFSAHFAQDLQELVREK